MKKIILYILVFLFKSNLALSNTMLPLENYLESNKNFSKDPRVTLYISDRCAGLNMFVATVMLTNPKGSQLAQRSEALSKAFMAVSYKLLTSKLNKKSKEAETIIKNSVQKKHKDYLSDGKDWQSKTGSYFAGSYIEKDMQICETIIKSL